MTENDECPVFGKDAGAASYRLTALEVEMREMRECHRSIAASLKKLTELEIHHAETRDSLSRAFGEIETIKLAIRDAPQWARATKDLIWMQRIVLAAVLSALLGLVILK